MHHAEINKMKLMINEKNTILKLYRINCLLSILLGIYVGTLQRCTANVHANKCVTTVQIYQPMCLKK